MKPIPSFIYKRSNQVAMVISVPLFAFIFITIYRPLDFDKINDGFLSGLNISRELAIQLITLLLVLVGPIVAAVSRVVMGIYTRKRQLSYTQYIGWIATEIVVMASLYTIAALLTESGKDVVTLFRNSLVKTILIMVIPYVICYIVFIWNEQAKQLRTLRERMHQDDSALQHAYTQIYDEKGEMRLSIRLENLLFVEAADNYICIWYSNNGSAKKILVRNTMKRIEEQLANSGIVRCHRSYMVNLEQLHILRREKEGLFIEMNIDGLPNIPVSKSYADSIAKWLTDHMN